MDPRPVPGLGVYPLELSRCHDCGRHVANVVERDHPERGRILVCDPCDFRLARDPLARDPLAGSPQP